MDSETNGSEEKLVVPPSPKHHGSEEELLVSLRPPLPLTEDHNLVHLQHQEESELESGELLDSDPESGEIVELEPESGEIVELEPESGELSPEDQVPVPESRELPPEDQVRVPERVPESGEIVESEPESGELPSEDQVRGLESGEFVESQPESGELPQEDQVAVLIVESEPESGELPPEDQVPVPESGVIVESESELELPPEDQMPVGSEPVPREKLVLLQQQQLGHDIGHSHPDLLPPEDVSGVREEPVPFQQQLGHWHGLPPQVATVAGVPFQEQLGYGHSWREPPPDGAWRAGGELVPLQRQLGYGHGWREPPSGPAGVELVPFQHQLGHWHGHQELPPGVLVPFQQQPWNWHGLLQTPAGAGGEPVQLQQQLKPGSGHCRREHTGRSHGAFLAARPGYGTSGESTIVLANHYRVRFSALKVFHYDVTIEPEPPKGHHRDIMKLAVEMYGEEKLLGASPAYDGMRSLYMVKQLCEETEMHVEFLPESDVSTRRCTNRYKITLRQASILDLTHLQDFLDGRHRVLPQDMLQCLDIVLREAATRCFLAKGRCFYGRHFGEDPLAGGLISYRGFYQSIRPAQNGLLSLNLDVAAAPFIAPVLVPEYLGLALQIKDPYELDRELSRPDGYGDSARVKARRLLKGIKIETIHNKQGKRKYRIQSISKGPLYSLRFDKKGESITVIDYFFRMYNYKICLPGLPAIESGSKDKKRYLPMEVCKIIEGQPYLKTLNEAQKRGIMTVSCAAPDKRRSITEQIHKELVVASRRIASEFGVQVNKFTTEIPARVLPAPSIQYQSAQVTPGEGSWTMKDKMMVKGCRIDRWSLINFSPNLQRKEVDNFCQRLPQECETYGIAINPILAVMWITESKADAERAIKSLYQACIEETNGELELLLCIMPQTNNKAVYASVKRVCEIELGLVTQCCLSDHIKRCRGEYIANLLLKINTKLGGYNAMLVDEKNKQMPLISDVPSIIIGADVSHPKIFDDTAPSISAAAATMDWPFFSQYEAIVQTQRQREEVCEGWYWEKEGTHGSKQTGGVIKELLWSFYERSGHKPERIIFYRDGVSEGEFEAVLKNEMEAVKKACEALGWGSRAHDQNDDTSQLKRSRPEESMPKITFIVVQKRHHTRFFPKDQRTQNGNIIPGTVVDSVICHPNRFDFYLCSHYGLKGTSRPAHYHVLRDENNFSVDEIQRLTHDLCFTYARCTRAVSIVPPCYYAHLAAVRARLWISGDGSDFAQQQEVASSIGSSRSGFYRSRGPTRPLPPLHEKIKRSMFYI